MFFLAAESYEDALDRLAVMHTAEVLAGRRRRSGQPKHLGLDPAPFPGWVNPGDRHRLKRILRPLELALIRLASLKRSPQHTAVAAFGEAGAVSGELPLITAKLLEFPPGTILLPGGVDGLHLRAATIPQWSAHFVETMVALRPNAPVLVYGGRSTDPRVVLAATGMAATTLLRDAGLGGDKSASYYSLRYTIGRQILESAGTDAAVEFLGEGNYDLVRQKLGLTPADPPRRRH